MFEEIEEMCLRKRPEMKVSKKYGRFLFRLVNFFGAKSVLQVGVSEGWKSMYLNAATRHLTVVDEDDGKEAEIVELNSELGNIDFISGVSADALRHAIEKSGALDVLFLNVSADEALTKRVFEQCLNYVHADTVFIIDGIRKRKMKKLWTHIRRRSDIPVTMDLHSMGLVFFNRKMYKKNYKLFF